MGSGPELQQAPPEEEEDKMATVVPRLGPGSQRALAGGGQGIGQLLGLLLARKLGLGGESRAQREERREAEAGERLGALRGRISSAFEELEPRPVTGRDLLGRRPSAEEIEQTVTGTPEIPPGRSFFEDPVGVEQPSAVDRERIFGELRLDVGTTPGVPENSRQILSQYIIERQREDRFSRIQPILEKHFNLPEGMLSAMPDTPTALNLIDRDLTQRGQVTLKFENNLDVDGRPVTKAFIFDKGTRTLREIAEFQGFVKDDSQFLEVIMNKDGTVERIVSGKGAALIGQLDIRRREKLTAIGKSKKNMILAVATFVGETNRVVPDDAVTGALGNFAALLESGLTQSVNAIKAANLPIPSIRPALMAELSDELDKVAGLSAERRAAVLPMAVMAGKLIFGEQRESFGQKKLQTIIDKLSPMMNAGSPLQLRRASQKLMKDLLVFVNTDLKTAEMTEMTMEELRTAVPSLDFAFVGVARVAKPGEADKLEKEGAFPVKKFNPDTGRFE